MVEDNHSKIKRSVVLPHWVMVFSLKEAHKIENVARMVTNGLNHEGLNDIDITLGILVTT